MINQYPLWKYLLVAGVLLVGIIYSVPSLYPLQSAVQITAVSDDFKIDAELKNKLEETLKQREVPVVSAEINVETKALVFRFQDSDTQAKAWQAISETIPRGYLVTFNLLPTTPAWLAAIGGAPMSLGLDLRGGVYFLMDVDMEAATAQAVDRMADQIRSILREADMHYLSVLSQPQHSIKALLDNVDLRDKALIKLRQEISNVTFDSSEEDGKGVVTVKLNEAGMREIHDFAVAQNVTTIRKRIDALGVSEPVVQRQGARRIVVELPGVQDPAQARDIISATATLEFRMEAKSSGPNATTRFTTYKMRDQEQTVKLENKVLATGDSITRAQAYFDPDPSSSGPAVSITLDDIGGNRFGKETGKRVGDHMGIVFIEIKQVTRLQDGKPVLDENGKLVKDKVTVKEAINFATIQSQLGRKFRITGLDSMKEAQRLAILLQAGALAAPIDIVEERTIGPSLGKENIKKGFLSVLVGFALVLAFMTVYYKWFGVVANMALLYNVVLMVAIMAILGATVGAALTLPGIAGIVLTIGMAVDANVLINERIREELRNGNTPQASIQAGYEKAFGTIADSNITTLIAGLVLFFFGTGPIKGFAVVLCIGIATSMFTAIMGTRAVVNWAYGGKRIVKLSI